MIPLPFSPERCMLPEIRGGGYMQFLKACVVFSSWCLSTCAVMFILERLTDSLAFGGVVGSLWFAALWTIEERKDNA